MLSKSAFNGLLKTLEEPPEHLKFIFATTEIRKVPVTVLSRCQRFDLRRIEAGEMANHLSGICTKEGVTIEEEALSIIARAAEGSVRDALSILDQAIAHGTTGGKSEVTAPSVRSMLGLSDRTRVIDLFEQVMSGDIQSALKELKSQYDVGAEPLVVLGDLADFTHLVTRLKYVPEAADDASLSEAERVRGKEFAEKLSVRSLGRAWQILLKGINEVGNSERMLPAAEMVLVRLTHASTLPSPDEVIRQIEAGETSEINTAAATPKSSNGQSSASTSSRSRSGSQPEMMSTNGSRPAHAVGQSEPVMAAEQAEATDVNPIIAIDSFEELIFLIEDKRDLKMKTAIARHVRLVSFVDGRIEMNLVENPPRDFLPTLSKQLEKWTSKRWMLSISQNEGSPTLNEQEQQETAQRINEARSDPAVEAILSRFPGSKIVDIRIRQEENEISDPPADENLDEFLD